MDRVEVEAKVLSAKLDMLGSDAMVREALGMFAMQWTMFENHLELLMWRLLGFDKKGTPRTDAKGGMTSWLKVYRNEIVAVNPSASLASEDFCSATIMLSEYRHAIFHGFYLPGLSAAVRNPAWNGMKRSRPTHVAHIDTRLLKMAAVAANWLLQYVIEVLKVLEGSEPTIRPKILLGLADAKSYSNELRYLTEIMNTERS